MMRGMGAIAQSIGMQEDANLFAQIAMATEAIVYAPAIVSLNEAWMETISTLSQDYAAATDRSVVPPPDTYPTNPLAGTGPHMAAVAAGENTKKTEAQSQSDLDTGNMNNLIDTIKSDAEFLSNALNNVFQFEQPIIELMGQITSLLMEV